MSQIETIMLVALGFAVAALIALFLGRIAWVFALRLGKKRMQRAAPTTIAELKSDRDRLRAEYAMLSRKLELRMSDLKIKLAEQMAEVSRNRNRIDHLVSEVRSRDTQLAQRDGELQELRMQLAPLETELSARTAAVQNLKEQLRGRDDEIHKLSQILEKLRAEISDRNRQVAAMKKDIADREAHGALLGPDALSAQDRLQKRIDDLMSLSRQIETQRRHLNQQKDEFESLKSEILSQRLAESAAPIDESGIGAPSAMAEGDAITTLDHSSRELERQLSAAERETAELESELKKLDENFNAKLAELNIAIDSASRLPLAEPTAEPPLLVEPSELSELSEPSEPSEPAAEIAAATGTEPLVPAAPSRPLRGVANVISLAARIRSQQKNAGD
jgi:chromosome segregation ATPase